jgi:hypothetical protein
MFLLRRTKTNAAIGTIFTDFLPVKCKNVN